MIKNPKADWRPPPLRFVFSDWTTERNFNLASPWISFTLTFEFRHPDSPAAEFFYQFTLPGCIYNPFKKSEHSDQFGTFRLPCPFGKGGTRINGPRLAPISLHLAIEAQLRELDRIRIWKAKMLKEYQRIKVDPTNEKEMKRLRRALRTGDAKEK